MALSIISIIVNILYFVVLNIDLYTDRAILPEGIREEWHRSPLDRLDVADNRIPLYLFLFFGAVCIISSVLFLFGVKHNVVKIIRLVSVIASTLMFIFIMIYTGAVHATY